MAAKMKAKVGLHRFFDPAPKPNPTKTSKAKGTSSPPPPKRPESPPHDYVLADNPDIAVGAIRVPSFDTSANPSIVHCYVPIALQQRVSQVTHALWPTRHRGRNIRVRTWRTCGKITLCVAGACLEQKERCRTRPPWARSRRSNTYTHVAMAISMERRKPSTCCRARKLQQHDPSTAPHFDEDIDFMVPFWLRGGSDDYQGILQAN